MSTGEVREAFGTFDSEHPPTYPELTAEGFSAPIADVITEIRDLIEAGDLAPTVEGIRKESGASRRSGSDQPTR